jgi:F-type H+-transporting ATPase subunit a
MLHISIAAEKLWSLGGLTITNSLLATWVTMALLFVFAFFATRNLSLVPTRIQSIAELIVGGLYDMFAQVTGHHIKKFFPLLASLFLFIITANWLGLLPGVGTIGFFHDTHEEVVTQEQVIQEPVVEATPAVDSHAEVDPHAEPAGAQEVAHTEAVPGEAHDEPLFTPLLRAATADLNMTIALGLITVVVIQYFGFSLLGFHYSSRFFNFSNPLMFFLGVLELVSEVSKVISFAFRLFGNIFAGEVLLAVMAFLMPFIVPLPFLTMELFVGMIQALVFSMLAAVFLNVAVSHGEEHA